MGGDGLLSTCLDGAADALSLASRLPGTPGLAATRRAIVPAAIGGVLRVFACGAGGAVLLYSRQRICALANGDRDGRRAALGASLAVALNIAIADAWRLSNAGGGEKA